jgi:hypothetical protein
MGLGEVFGESFKDYSRNFKLVLQSYLWLSILPMFFLYLIAGTFSVGLGNISSKGLAGAVIGGFATKSIESNSSSALNYWISFAVIFVIFFFLSLWLYLIIYYAAFNNKGKLRFKEAAGKSLDYFWRFLGIGIVTVIVTVLPFVILILGIVLLVAGQTASGIILLLIFLALFVLVSIRIFVYWLLAQYAIFKKNTRVIESLRVSKKLVEGKWWRVFGYVMLIVGITIGVSVTVLIPRVIFQLIGVVIASLAHSEFASLVFQFIDFLFQTVVGILMYPFSIFFFKNLYLELLQESKKNRKKR